MEKYGNRDDRLPVNKWLHVQFKVMDENELELVSKWHEVLAGMGVAFDTGGTGGIIDWELDWSFHLAADSAEGQGAREVVKDAVKRMQGCNTAG